ncbi:pantothenate kinase [Williamsia limnetica]|uniref:Pantothenate kinase n=1 Tax=Williamsia limnetica TaxID=882452 RepID=A0A318RAW7_WILLI|nr:nucleoside/nucleotide kinase family protein [Williamsia limnetica]PYE12136.1 pantothenate kinase [Williamsia limnetica]
MITRPAELIDRIERLRSTRERVLIGIVGEPGSGKSTVSGAVADELGTDAVVVPMDGFHLSNEELARLCRSDRKGAIDTFDAFGYLQLIRRLCARDEPVVYAPDYVRGVEEAIAGSIAVSADVPVVITEGNYLLDEDEPWPGLRDLVDEIWYVEAPHHLRLERLVERHIRFGMSESAAWRWAEGPDESNAQRVRARRGNADLVIDVTAFAAGDQR